MVRTEQMLTVGFAEWELLKEGLNQDLQPYVREDPQLFADMKVLMERARAGSCRRAVRGQAVPDEGDWDSPMVSSSREMAELRMPYHPNGWLPRVYISACSFTYGVMVALKFGVKGAGDDAAGLQNEHIREAEDRLNRRDLAKGAVT